MYKNLKMTNNIKYIKVFKKYFIYCMKKKTEIPLH